MQAMFNVSDYIRNASGWSPTMILRNNIRDTFRKYCKYL